MICRRCGLESSTRDICEWCKKPMLPEGSTISAKAKQELLKERAKAEAEAKAPPEPPKPPSEEEMAPARPGLTAPPPPPEVHESGLLTLGSHLGAGSDEPKEESPSLYAAPVAADSDPLRPLGASTANQDDGSADLSAETARYIGNDESSVLRPIERPQGQGSSQWVIDPATGKRKRVVNTEPEVPDNTRILRATPYGSIAGFAVALLEFVIFHKIPSTIATWSAWGLSTSPSFGTAIVYGIYCAILLGFPLAAILVNRKWGAPAGFFLGVAVGFLVLGQGQDSPIPLISVLQGALAGILVGRVTGKGVKRIISV